MLLEPTIAQKWIGQGGLVKPPAGNIGTGTPQPLFNETFAQNCGDKCAGIWQWTGYIPPIEQFANQSAVAAYVRDVKATKADADTSNAFVEGGYVGMKLMVEALKRVGPNLSRKALTDAIYALTLDTGLSKPLAWKQGNHFANTCMMAFEIKASGGFAGWRHAKNFVCDP